MGGGLLSTRDVSGSDRDVHGLEVTRSWPVWRHGAQCKGDRRQTSPSRPLGVSSGVSCVEVVPAHRVSFISSTNNHISRITSLMHRLSKHFSPPLLTLGNPDGLATTTYHTFPDPHLLPRQLERVLREMGFGYRAGFIESSLETLRAQFGDNPGEVEVGLHKWRTSDIDEVREKLLELKGIGRKVADCVMLMCLDQVSNLFGESADVSPLSFPSTPTSELSLRGIRPSLPVCGINPCRNSSTMRSNLFSSTSGVHWGVGVRPSCSRRICP